MISFHTLAKFSEWTKPLLLISRYANALQWDIFASFSGCLAAFSFAPFSHPWLMFLALPLFMMSCINASPKRAFIRGIYFGVTQFAIGLAWIFDSLLIYSKIHPAILFLITAALVFLMAIYPAVSAYTAVRLFRLSHGVLVLIGFPIFWTLCEFFRSTLLSGFPWLLVAQAQIDSPLVGYVSLIGELGLSYVVCLISGLILFAVLEPRMRPISLLSIFILIFSGYLINRIDWHSASGKAIRISLLQGNIATENKWQKETLASTKEWYYQQTLKNAASDLVVWPETAVPAFSYQMEKYLQSINQLSRDTNTQILLGILQGNRETKDYYNAMISTGGSAYYKKHLVPFGEFFPLNTVPAWLKPWMSIPASNIKSGPKHQSNLFLSGQTIGPSICFEIAYAKEILKSLPAATLLVNISDDTFVSNTIEPHQALQIGRLRAIESGRYLVRSANSGFSVIIDPKGNITDSLELHRTGTLTADIQPLKGSTPYVRFGNTILFAIFLLQIPLALGILVRYHNSGTRPT